MTKRRFWLSAAAVSAAFVLTAVPAVRADREFGDDSYFSKADDPEVKGLESLVGKPPPALTVKDWRGAPVAAADMKGKVVVIDIWATWCGPCLASIPHNNELMKEYGPKGLVIVGVCSSGQGQDQMTAVADDKKVAYPLAQDVDNKTAEAFKISFFPTYVVVGRDGKVRAAGLTPDGVGTAVKKLIDEKAAG